MTAWIRRLFRGGHKVFKQGFSPALIFRLFAVATHEPENGEGTAQHRGTFVYRMH